MSIIFKRYKLKKDIRLNRYDRHCFKDIIKSEKKTLINLNKIIKYREYENNHDYLLELIDLINRNRQAEPDRTNLLLRLVDSCWLRFKSKIYRIFYFNKYCNYEELTKKICELEGLIND